MIEQTFVRELGSLEQIFDFMDQTGRFHRLPEGTLYNFKLCIEELFVNMVRYQPQSKQPVTLQIDIEPKKITVTLIDREVDRFDVSQPRRVDTGAPLEERKPGGLGIFLVHHLMDQVLYDYNDRTSVITLVKKL